ncbi:hypothetical protein EPN95_02120 [Patescibacteria group bacterium]|nr:MAG: hypothetical protein EPN95_02120 [Patescibacteria group bacterium]
MAAERYYKQRLDELKGPKLTNDLFEIARTLFETASGDAQSGLVVPEPTRFVDDVNASRVWWKTEDENERELFEARLFDGGLTFILEHHQLGDVALHSFGHSFVDHRQVALAMGSQRPVLFAHDGVSVRGRRDVLNGRETLLPAFRDRLDHTMGMIGIHEAIPDVIPEIPQLQELLLAS